ncbi:MAG TPA: hypothetical protein VIJ18_00405 [Microbacteriaceae bacterium]
MWNSPKQVLKLRLSVLDVGRPIERVIAVDAAMRLESLHSVIHAAFAWTGRQHRHVFTNSRSAVQHERQPVWAVGRYDGARTQLIWEMDHGCRNGEHTSLCEWTSTVAQALDEVASTVNGPELFYEYGLKEGPHAHEYNDCALLARDLCNDHWPHGWTIAVEELDRYKPGRSEEFPTLLDGCGRSPLLESSGPRGDAALNALLDTPEHPRHSEIDTWVRQLEGPWAAHDGRAFDPNRFDLSAAAQVFGSRSDSYGYSYNQRADRATVGGVELSEDATRAAAAIPRRHRIDVLSAAADRVLAHPEGLAPNTVQWLTAPLDALLHRIAAADSARQPDTAAMRTTDRCDVESGVNELFARSLRLVVRRAGYFRLTRAGEAALGEPSALLNACLNAYWTAATDPSAGLYVLLGVISGLAGDDLLSQVGAAVVADQLERNVSASDWDGERTMPANNTYGRDASAGSDIDSYVAYLARFGSFTGSGDDTRVTADGAALAMTLLTR